MRFCRQGPSLVVHTPAKLNLFLEVRGRRPDGFHELETIMVSINLFDTLRVTPRPAGGLSLRLRNNTGVAWPEIPTDDRNLVLQAARLLAEHCDVAAVADIDLIKRIPVESGLGGGSGNSAAALLALNRLWKTGLSRGELHQLAAKLGSDVNFFLDSIPAAVCRGRGEAIQPISLVRPLHFVVIRPAGGLATKDVFRHLRFPTGTEPRRHLESAAPLEAELQRGRTARIGRQLHNSLERAARELSGEVSGLLRRCGKYPVSGSAMTGSGTACYVLCRSARHARVLASRIRNHTDGHIWSVSTCV